MRLLIATDFPPDAPGGGPAVIRQMLKDFPGEIHWWSCRPSVRGSSFRVRGSESWQRGESAEEAGGGWRVAGFEVSSFECCPPRKLMPARKLTRVKAWLMEHVWVPRAARSLRQTIGRVRPDAIWIIPHDWSILPLGRVMCSEWRVAGPKPRIHVTIQDFPDCHGHEEAWGHERVLRMARLQEQIYARADTADATSLPMLEELERRTGKRGLQMLHQGLEPEDFAYLKSVVSSSSRLVGQTEPVSASNEEPRTKNYEPIKIAYAGTILCQREFALFVEILKKLREPNQEPGTKNYELHLYGAHSYREAPWFDATWMQEHGNLSERDLLKALRTCDWGFIPMSLDDEDPRYNRFSFPTKFITYLAAGLPIIAMGHPESSVMKMASQGKTGVVAEKADTLADILATAFANRRGERLLTSNIYACADKFFHANRMRKVLHACLAGKLPEP